MRHKQGLKKGTAAAETRRHTRGTGHHAPHSCAGGNPPFVKEALWITSAAEKLPFELRVGGEQVR